MKFGSVMKGFALAAIASLSIGASGDALGQSARPAAGNWNTAIIQTDGGHRIGNPDAKVKLIEFVSYTCPHCAAFTVEGDGALQLVFVGPGRVSREIRHIVRDPVDLTAAMLANCGAVKKFPGNHAALMRSQKKWLPVMASATPAQRQRWTSGDYSTRRRAIASDFGFYDLMERRGYRATDINRCLSNDAMATRLAETSSANLAKYNLSGTPSFAIDGLVLLATHNWSALEPQLSARF